jgi:hypothetical protein
MLSYWLSSVGPRLVGYIGTSISEAQVSLLQREIGNVRIQLFTGQ